MRKALIGLLFMAGMAHADLTTSSMGLTLPTTGQADNWGRKINHNFQIIDSVTPPLGGNNTWTGSQTFPGLVTLSTAGVFQLFISTNVKSTSNKLEVNGPVKLFDTSGATMALCDRNGLNCQTFSLSHSNPEAGVSVSTVTIYAVIVSSKIVFADGSISTTAVRGAGSTTIIGGGGSSSLAIFDEGVQTSSPSLILNFVGAGVTATLVGGATAQISIPGGSASTPISFIQAGVAISSPTKVISVDTNTLTATLVGGSTTQLAVSQDLRISTLTLTNFPLNVPTYVDASGILNGRAIRLNSTDIEGVLPVANGGTGQSLYTDGTLMMGNSSTGGLSSGTLTAGSNITITNGNGAITIASTGGGGGGGSSSLAVSKNGVPISSPTAAVDFRGEGIALSLGASATAQVTIVSTTAYTTKNQTWTSPQTWTSSGSFATATASQLSLYGSGGGGGSNGNFIRAIGAGGVLGGFFGWNHNDTATAPAYGRGFQVQNDAGGSATAPAVFAVESLTGKVISLGGFTAYTTSQLRLYDSGNTKYVSFRSSNTLNHTADYIVPDSTGTVDTVLAIRGANADGSVPTYWKTLSAGSGDAVLASTQTFTGGTTIKAPLTVKSTATINRELLINSSDPANFVKIIANDTTSVFEFFQNGFADHTLTIGSGVATFNGSLAVDGSITAGTGNLKTSGVLVSADSGASIGPTDAGIVSLWSSTAEPSYISFNERGVANNGALGFAAGSSNLVFRSGTETIGSGTERFQINPTGGMIVTSSATIKSGLGTTFVKVSSMVVWADGSVSTSAALGSVASISVAAPITLSGSTVGIDPSSATLLGPQISLNNSEVTGALPEGNMVSTAAFTTKNQTWTTPQTWTSSATFSTVGISSGVFLSTGGFVNSDEYQNGPYLTISTITWTNGNFQRVTLTANTTFLFSAPPHPATLTLRILTGAGSFTATWPAAVKWSGGVAPTITVTASKSDFVVCKYAGDGNYYCSASGSQNF